MSTIAQFLWIGGSLSTLEKLCLASFVAQGYETHLYTYDSVEGVPAGVRIMPGEDILPRSCIFTYKEGFGKGSYAGFSDWFRYELIFKRGGWWFDMDFVALRPPDHCSELLVASSYEDESGECPNACVLHAPAGHPALAWLCTEARACIESGNIQFGDIGPFLVNRLINEQKLHRHMAPWWHYSPYPWRQMYRVPLPTLQAVIKDWIRMARFLWWQVSRPHFRAGWLRRDSRAIHLHNEIWRSMPLDKNAAYHPLCVYERLKRRYNVS